MPIVAFLFWGLVLLMVGGGFPQMPSWWREANEKTHIWLLDSFSRTLGEKSVEQIFSSEITIMTWDEDGLAQYYWSGID